MMPPSYLVPMFEYIIPNNLEQNFAFFHLILLAPNKLES